MNRGQTETILVVHVPKAAGSTLRWLLDRQYPQSLIFKIGDDIPGERMALEGMSEERIRRLRAIFGHMCWGWHEVLPFGQGFQYVTMLREPVERCLSMFAYTQLPGHYMNQAVRGMGLVEYLESGVTRTCDNGMVRQLCGEDQFLRAPYGDMVLSFRGVTRAHLEQAKRNLDRCAVVGVAERFGEMMTACQRRFGWRIPQIQNQNVTRWHRIQRQQLDRRQVEALMACNALDMELYEYAKGMGAG